MVSTERFYSHQGPRDQDSEKSNLGFGSGFNRPKMFFLAGAAYLLINGILCPAEAPKTEPAIQELSSSEAGNDSARPSSKFSEAFSEAYCPETIYQPDETVKIEHLGEPRLTPVSYSSLEQLLEEKESQKKEQLEELEGKLVPDLSNGSDSSALVADAVRPELHPKIKKRYRRYKKSREYERTIQKIEESFGGLIRAASEKYLIPEAIIYAIIINESDGNPKLRSTISTAKGMMQILDGTARDLGCGNRFDPGEAIDCGTKYLYQIRGRYREMAPALPKEEILNYMIAAYNQGPNGTLKQNIKKSRLFWSRSCKATDYVIKARAVEQLVVDYLEEKAREAERKEKEILLN